MSKILLTKLIVEWMLKTQKNLKILIIKNKEKEEK